MSEGRGRVAAADVYRRLHGPSAGPGPGATLYSCEKTRSSVTAVTPYGWGKATDVTPTSRGGWDEEERGWRSEGRGRVVAAPADVLRRLHGLSEGPGPGATVNEDSRRSATTAPFGWGEATVVTPTTRRGAAGLGVGLGLGLRPGSESPLRPPAWTGPGSGATANEDSRRSATTAPSGLGEATPGRGEATDVTPTARGGRGPVGLGLGLGLRSGSASRPPVWTTPHAAARTPEARTARWGALYEQTPVGGGAMAGARTGGGEGGGGGGGGSEGGGTDIRSGAGRGRGGGPRTPEARTVVAAFGGGGGGFRGSERRFPREAEEEEEEALGGGGGGVSGSDRRHPREEEEEDEEEAAKLIARVAGAGRRPSRTAPRPPPPVPPYVAAEAGRY